MGRTDCVDAAYQALIFTETGLLYDQTGADSTTRGLPIYFQY